MLEIYQILLEKRELAVQMYCPLNINE